MDDEYLSDLYDYFASDYEDPEEPTDFPCGETRGGGPQVKCLDCGLWVWPNEVVPGHRTMTEREWNNKLRAEALAERSR